MTKQKLCYRVRYRYMAWYQHHISPSLAWPQYNQIHEKCYNVVLNRNFRGFAGQIRNFVSSYCNDQMCEHFKILFLSAKQLFWCKIAAIKKIGKFWWQQSKYFKWYEAVKKSARREINMTDTSPVIIIDSITFQV